jgi:AhpD family alkylhydroperoxidase
MRLEQRDKELAAIGASIGANCRPCIEHHLPAGREAGLSESELADAVATAHSVHHRAIELFSARVDELLGRRVFAPAPSPVTEPSRLRVLVGLGASIGANSHPLLDLHIPIALEAGLSSGEIEAAMKMAEYVQDRAAEITAKKARHVGESIARLASGVRRPNRYGFGR